MTTARRLFLRRVMSLAWGLYRDRSVTRTFAEALRGAWHFIDRMAAKPCKLARALRAGRHVQMADTIASPLRRRYGANASVGGRASANYLTAVLGA